MCGIPLIQETNQATARILVIGKGLTSRTLDQILLGGVPRNDLLFTWSKSGHYFVFPLIPAAAESAFKSKNQAGALLAGTRRCILAAR